MSLAAIGVTPHLGARVLGLAAALAAAAGPPRLTVELEPPQVTVGDRVRATLEVVLPGGEEGEPYFPAWGASWGEAEVLAVAPVERAGTEGGDRIFRQRLELTAFRVGRVPLPPVAVDTPAAARLATPDDLALDVRSVLPPGEAAPQPPEPPRPLPLGEAFWWTAALLAAAGLALAWAGRPVGAAAGTPAPADPLTELGRALATLRGASDAGRVHAELSRALRRYLGRSLSFSAMECTTLEVGRHLARRRDAASFTAPVRDLLVACDRVKFAREPATPGEAGERLAAAQALAEELARRLAAAAAARKEAA